MDLSNDFVSHLGKQFEAWKGHGQLGPYREKGGGGVGG